MSENDNEVKKEAGACGPGCGCGCGSAGAGGKCGKIFGVLVVIVVCALVVRALSKDKGSAVDDKASAGFSALPAATQKPMGDAPAGLERTNAPEESGAEQAVTNALEKVEAEQAMTNALKEISAIMDLNTVATGSKGVFIYVPAKGPAASTSPLATMLSAAQKIEPQAGGKIGMFTLKVGSPDYEKISVQLAVPGVIVLAPGGRMVPVTGEITETKLVQGFLSSVQSCGAGGCGPSGCG